MNISIPLIIMMVLTSFNSNQSNTEILYTFPEESSPHEGTWLQWPHQYEYGITYRDRKFL